MGYGGQSGVGAASVAVLLAYVLASCAQRVDGPAPVVTGETAEQAPASVTVQRGQTLSGIAHAYHVPMRVVAEANGLSSPYSIQAGRTLIIPRADHPQTPAASISVAASVAALPPTVSEPPPPSTRLEPPAVPGAPETGSADRPVPGLPERLPPVATPPLAAASPPAGETSAKPSPATPPPVTASLPPPTSSEPPTAPPAIRGNGAFLWPVRGHLVATYGLRSDGTHNDGINIAAPKGVAVQVAEAGVVAYSGNELRGYGNLILVKHANGWISAYAHCDQMLVQRGQKVARGQVIARVGSTGNVSEPQLHFELRRGNRAVDPQEFLTPLPTAGTVKTAPRS
jgi:murein DD-endopeptidase MepM/ murein hydrolase activator NlpD